MSDRSPDGTILIIDLEATCADDGSVPRESREVIELGAVIIATSGDVLATMQRFVCPVEYPRLTDFCRSLTHIEQADIDIAENWPQVAAELSQFVQLHSVQRWGSWGDFDRRQIERESLRRGISNPLAELPHKNLKAAFAKAHGIKQVGMATALQIAGLEMKGEHHRALSDAIHIARLLSSC
ncbi:MAG TPA: 3'-5' exonuclease [Bradyrhizobium sp.]